MKIFLSKTIAILHTVFVFIPGILILFIHKPIYDLIVLLCILFIRGHWLLLNGECCIAYIEKKLVIPNYKLGQDIFCSPSKIIFGQDKIDLDDTRNLKPEDYKDIADNLLLLFLLFRNRNSKYFKTMLIIVLAAILCGICFNRIERKIIKNIRKKCAENNITGLVPISDLKVY